MTERPILFSGPMVRALLDGSKTQTRRVLRRQPYVSRSCPPNFSDAEPGDLFVCPDMFPTTDQPGSVIAECESIGTYHCMGQRAFAEKHSPYGQPGDRLWVRETWAQPTTLDPGPTFYRADYPACAAGFTNLPPVDEITWKPSIHMFRKDSRILLEITGVRVERLQAISDQDAIAEGIRRVGPGWERWHPDPDDTECTGSTQKPRLSYQGLWESINGAGSWEANPWVWVVEFRRIGS